VLLKRYRQSPTTGQKLLHTPPAVKAFSPLRYLRDRWTRRSEPFPLVLLGCPAKLPYQVLWDTFLWLEPERLVVLGGQFGFLARDDII
jgi:hypothetical protein